MPLNQELSYRRYQRYFVNLGAHYQKKEVGVYTGLVLSLFTIAFFGFFALRPTLTTIASLLRELQDKKTINQKLEEKINNLNQAQTNFFQISAEVSLLDQALPLTPTLSQIISQIEALAHNSNVSLSSLNFEPLKLQGEKSNSKNETSFSATLVGNFEDLKNFLNELGNLRRMVSIDSLDLSPTKIKETPTMTLTIVGKAYFFPK